MSNTISNHKWCLISPNHCHHWFTSDHHGLILLQLECLDLDLERYYSVCSILYQDVLFCSSYQADNTNEGLTYIILLPGGLQVFSGWVDFQRGSYFGGIVFLGFVLQLFEI